VSGIDAVVVLPGKNEMKIEKSEVLKKFQPLESERSKKRL